MLGSFRISQGEQRDGSYASEAREPSLCFILLDFLF